MANRLRPAVLLPAAAAAVVIGFGVMRLAGPAAPNRLASFEARMVGNAQREYRMDIQTGDMARIREYLAARRAPGDYDVAAGRELRARNAPAPRLVAS